MTIILKHHHMVIHNDSIESTAEEIEMHSFWFTIFEILQNMWSIAIGFILIECFVYYFVDGYVNLLIEWSKTDKHLIKDNIIDMIFVGFIIAIATAFGQGIIEMTFKRPCYENIYHKMNNNTDNTDNHCYKFNVFVLNLANDIDGLWMTILSAAIGWSLLTPSQAKEVWSALETASLGSIAFVIFGLLTEKCKFKKQKRILYEINAIKDYNSNEIDKEKLLMDKTRKLILYDKLIEIYDAAFAVSISFAWESFASLALKSTYKGLKHVELFIITVVYTVCITLIYIQLGLQLTDLLNKRRKDSMQKLSNEF